MKGLTQEQALSLFPPNIIFVGYRGSVAHGMYRPPSDPNSVDDKDLMGVFFCQPEHYLGFGRREDHEKFINEWDVVCYEVRKFLFLLMKSNPNVLSMLWLDKKHILLESDWWRRIADSRDMFVSKKAYHSFTGYAYSQLKRMERFKFEGYMGEKRKALVEKHGYDTKNAAHLIRLLRMGIEFLVEGRLHVEREDAAQLLDIKNGLWPLERVKSEAEVLFSQAREAYVSSRLPDEPDREGIERLLVALVGDWLHAAKGDQ